jgi:hypothetical protein
MQLPSAAWRTRVAWLEPISEFQPRARLDFPAPHAKPIISACSARLSLSLSLSSGEGGDETRRDETRRG